MVKNVFFSPSECPLCGESVPRGARACPGCGADERTGWNEEATRYDGLDLPESAFTDEGDTASRRKHGRGLGIIVAVALVILLIFSLIPR